MEFIKICFAGIAMMLIIALVMSLPVMLLWDWLMPTIFGLREITWFQAWGLLALCSILFKTNFSSKSD